MKQLSPSNDIIIDVSHFQGPNIDWLKVATTPLSDGRKVKGAILKATQGTTFIDETVYPNYNAAKANGLAVGLYHYTKATSVSAALAEVDFFCQVFDACGGVNGLDIPPVLDIEDSSIKALGLSAITSIADAWLSKIQNKYGITPWIYANLDWINNYLDSSLGKYPLWLASYGNALPTKQTWCDWTCWQFTQTGSVSGINSNVDINEYAGSVDDLLYKMDQQVAMDLLAMCKNNYNMAISQQDKDAWHKRAEELRKAGDLPADA